MFQHVKWFLILWAIIGGGVMIVVIIHNGSLLEIDFMNAVLREKRFISSHGKQVFETIGGWLALVIFIRRIVY